MKTILLLSLLALCGCHKPIPEGYITTESTTNPNPIYSFKMGFTNEGGPQVLTQRTVQFISWHQVYTNWNGQKHPLNGYFLTNETPITVEEIGKRIEGR